MYIPEIPDNSLTEEIKEIVEVCQKQTSKYGKNAYHFNPPASEEEINLWETKNDMTLPESYKDWLRFSNGSEILNWFITVYKLDMIGEYDKYVSDDLKVMGEIIGDGEFLCFSIKTKNITSVDHGKIHEYGSFKDFLRYYIPMFFDDSL